MKEFNFIGYFIQIDRLMPMMESTPKKHDHTNFSQGEAADMGVLGRGLGGQGRSRRGNKGMEW